MSVSFVLQSSLMAILLETIQSKDICHSNQSEALRANNISHPWFHHIATSSDYDAEWPSFSGVELSAYQAISNYLTEYAVFRDAHDDIRSIYGSLSSETIETLRGFLSGSGTDWDQLLTVQPTECDATCWSTVTTQLDSDELLQLLTVPLYRASVHEFFDQAIPKYGAIITEVEELLEISKSTVVVTQSPESGGDGAWSTAVSVINSFAGLISLATDDPGIQLAIWVITGTDSIGTGVIDGQSSGYTVTISLNNALWKKASEYRSQVIGVLTGDRNTTDTDASLIKGNYGKLQKFLECYSYFNTERTDSDDSWDSVADRVAAQASKWMKLGTFQALLPAKYQFWAQFSCANNIDDSQCDCGTSTLYPSCSYTSAESLSQSGARTISGGEIVGFLGAKGSDDPGNSLNKTAAEGFNQALSDATGSSEYTLTYILNEMDISSATSTSFPDYVSYHLTSTVEFNFEAGMISSWCAYECEGKNEFECAGGNIKPKACTLCTGCVSQCGSSCSSCLSSTTTVLMADNEYKAISDIAVGDAVMNPLSGTEQIVAAVANTLRNRRELYAMNGLGFNFTKAHPFLLDDDGIAAMDSNELLFYLPSFDASIMEDMIVNASLSVFTNGAISSSVFIEDIERFDFDETAGDSDGEILYDLIFDFTMPSAYVVNDGIVIYSEWYDFTVYPKTTQIILGVVSNLIQTEDHILQRLSKTQIKNRDILNHMSSLISGYTLSFYNIVNDHINAHLWANDTSNSSTCAAFELDTANTDGLDVLFAANDDLWAVGKATEEFIARASPKLNYVFYSEYYTHVDDICFDEVAPLLVEDLISGLTDAVQALEMYIETDVNETETTSTQAAVVTESTEWYTSTAAQTTQVQDDVSVTFPITVCIMVTILVVAFVY